MNRIERMKQLAVEEAKKLKKFATAEEKERLNVRICNPSSVSRCIYGLMTGDCESNRAEELIIKCAPRVYNTSTVVDPVISGRLNGKPYKTTVFRRTWRYMSPIELIIFDNNMGKEAIEKLIPFIKGETKTLKLV